MSEKQKDIAARLKELREIEEVSGGIGADPAPAPGRTSLYEAGRRTFPPAPSMTPRMR